MTTTSRITDFSPLDTLVVRTGYDDHSLFLYDDDVDSDRTDSTEDISPILTNEFRYDPRTMGEYDRQSSQASFSAPSSANDHVALNSTSTPFGRSPDPLDTFSYRNTGYTPKPSPERSSFPTISPSLPPVSPVSPIAGSTFAGSAYYDLHAAPTTPTHTHDDRWWDSERSPIDHIDSMGTTNTPMGSTMNGYSSDSGSSVGTASIGRRSSVSSGSVRPDVLSARLSFTDFNDLDFINKDGFYDSTKEKEANQAGKEQAARSFYGVLPETNVTNQRDPTSYAPSLTSNRSTRSVLSRISSKISDWRRDRRGSGSLSGDESRSGGGSMASSASSIAETRSRFRTAWRESTAGLLSGWRSRGL